jgi:hypothetical protein
VRAESKAAALGDRTHTWRVRYASAGTRGDSSAAVVWVVWVVVWAVWGVVWVVWVVVWAVWGVWVVVWAVCCLEPPRQLASSSRGRPCPPPPPRALDAVSLASDPGSGSSALPSGGSTGCSASHAATRSDTVTDGGCAGSSLLAASPSLVGVGVADTAASPTCTCDTKHIPGGSLDTMSDSLDGKPAAIQAAWS